MGLQQIEESDEYVSETSKLRETIKKPWAAVNVKLIPLKLAILLFYGADSLFLPYLTLQMVQIGLDLEEVAIIYAVLPFVTFVVPPLAGLLADKFNRYKLFLIGLVAVTATFHTLLIFVDARVSTDTTQYSTQMECDRSGTALRFIDRPDAGNNSSSICSDTDAGTVKWSATFIPSECRAVDCAYHQDLRMNHCSYPPPEGSVDDDDECNPVNFHSRSQWKVQFQLFFTDRDNCTARVVNATSSSQQTTTGVSDPASSFSHLFCNCLIQCPTQLKLLIELSPEEKKASAVQIEADRVKHQRGFWIYFILRIIASSTLAAAFSMLDATAICMVKKYQGDLGKQRLFGVIGQATFGMIGGLLLEWTQEMKGFPDYSLLFFLADGLFFVGILLICMLDVDVEHPENGNLKASLGKLFRMIDVDVFLLMMLLLGTCWGYLESFLFVFLNELKASSFLLGTTVFVGCAIGVPFLYISDRIVHKIGSVNVIALAFILYCFRFFGYSLIWEPWLCLIFEALEAVTVHMMAVASSVYCAAAAPPGLLATLNGAVGSVHYSFGRGVGSFAGGILMSNYGTRKTFQLFGSCALVCGVFYFLAHRFFLVKMEKVRLRRKSEHIAEVIASGAEPEEDEPNEKFIIPPDQMLGRRMSCF